MVVNDYAGFQAKRGSQEFIASKLAPTEGVVLMSHTVAICDVCPR
jgi:hypothetical protein